jgi:hypothetical protein
MKEKSILSNKKIIFTYNYAVNYIMHIFALSNIIQNTQYAQKYRSTIQLKDLKYLQTHKYLLEFGNGRCGNFTSICFFLPSYLDLKTKNDFVEYYSLFIDGLKERDFSKFLKKYSIDWKDPFLLTNYKKFFFEISNIKSGKEVEIFILQLNKLSRIFINNVDGYNKIWEKVEKVLQERIEKLNYLTNYFNKNNIIQKWEEITGKTFIKDNYHILLCYANKNGPNANSLSYDKNVFYYNSSDKYLRDFVSHEIGTHLLSELFYSEAFDPIRYAAVECFAMFLNFKVLKSKKLNYNLSSFHCDKFLNLYKKHYYKGITPEKLIEIALKEIKNHKI